MPLCLASEKGKNFKVGPTMHSANDQIICVCLCAIVPLCLAPEKAKITDWNVALTLSVLVQDATNVF